MRTTPTWRHAMTHAVIVSLVAGGGAALAPSASAAPVPGSRSVDYACQSVEGTSQLRVDYGWALPDPPETIPLAAVYGKLSTWSTDISLASAVPGEIAQQAAAEGAVSVKAEGGVGTGDDTGFHRSGFSASVPLGDQTEPTDVPFESPMRYYISNPGAWAITADDPTLNLTFRRADGEVVRTTTLTCSSPESVLLDTVWARSNSTVRLRPVLSRAYVYGQPIELAAQVTVAGRQPGWVDFTVGGRTQRAATDSYGALAVTTFVEPISPGTYPVTTSFVPANPQLAVPSSEVGHDPVSVAPAQSTSRFRVTGKRTTRATKVRVRVLGQYATTPSGRVSLALTRKISKHKKRTVHRTATLDDARALKGFGTLRPGRYRLVVEYAGDGNHLPSRAVDRFRVRR